MKVVLLFLLLACSTAQPLPEPASLTSPAFAIDSHLHLTMASAAHPFFVGMAGRDAPVESTGAQLRNQIDPVQLRSAGVKLVFAALWPPPASRPGRSAFDETLRQIDVLDALVSEQPIFSLVKRSADVPAAVARGQIAVVPHVEGGEGISSLDDVDTLYAAGLRGLTVVHFSDSQLGGAAAGQLGSLLGIQPPEHNPLGLTALGREVVVHLLELGVLIDLAHCSDQTASEVLDLAEARGVPVLVTHTAARAFTHAERNLSDALLKRVAAGGGLIGITLNSPQLQTPSELLGPSQQRGTCDDVVAHWRHFAQLVPETNLVLGSDMNGLIARPAAGGACPNGIRNTGDLPALWAALVAAGISQRSLDQMGPELLALWAKVESKADPRAQKRALRKRPTPARSLLTE